MSNIKNSEIPFENRPVHFHSITIWDRLPALEFVIDQLEVRGKKYSIEKRGGLMRVWSKTLTNNY